MDGNFLDFKNIPILNSDTSLPMLDADDVSKYFSNLIYAAVINSAWIKQNVFLMCYPMTQAECMCVQVS